MTVAELIDKLNNLTQEKQIVINVWNNNDRRTYQCQNIHVGTDDHHLAELEVVIMGD